MTDPIPGGANAVFGIWFVQSCVPTPFEKNVYNGKENYEWVDESKQKLKVTFTHQKGSFDAPVKTMHQDGVVVNTETGAQWKVRPRLAGIPMPVWLPFIILATIPDEYMIVGYPDRSYLWIMTRKWDYPKEEYAKLEARAVDEFGYLKEKIVLVPQKWD